MYLIKMCTSNFIAYTIGRKTITVPEVKSFERLHYNNAWPDCPCVYVLTGFTVIVFIIFFKIYIIRRFPGSRVVIVFYIISFYIVSSSISGDVTRNWFT